MDPRSRLILVFCAGVLAICLERSSSLGTLVFLCTAPLLFMPVGLQWWRRGFLAVAAIVWSTMFSQGLFYAEQPRVSIGCLGPLCLYREGLTYGLAQSLRFVALSMAGLSLSLSTPPDRLYAALLRFRLPFGLALMAAAALRFVPEVAREMMVVRRARAHRGRPAHHRSPLQWMLLEVGLLRPVVARAWRRAQNLAESLDTRGFDPVAPRAVRRPLKYGPLDAVALIAALTLTTGVVIMRVLYLLYTTETFYHPALRPMYGLVRSWI